MRYIPLTILLCAVASSAMAQKPHYLPGDGVYIVGLPANQNATYDCPVMVAEAYQATFRTTDAELASIAADKSYNISSRLKEDGTLDLISFMGCGAATNLTVRNYDGDSYTIGDYALQKTWSTSYLVAAYAPWDGKQTYTLGVYDHWDCPVSYDADPMLTERKASALTVDFGNPHEGLVCQGVNFNLISADTGLKNKVNALTVALDVWDEDRQDILLEQSSKVSSRGIQQVGTTADGKCLYSVYVNFSTPLVIDHPFTVSIEGFDMMDAEAWLPRAVDTHGLYPTHTTYHLETTDEQIPESDACVNIEGYFNYIGTWGWYDGKCEYGECVAQGDYVQVYIDPTDPDWPGMYFTGDPTFPVECAFGVSDLVLDEKPDWISDVQIDGSQWEQYGALLIIMQADALPAGETGRYGKVVISTSDDASKYTIHIRQGNGTFPSAIDELLIDAPVSGGLFDLMGRAITAPLPGQVHILDGRKVIKKSN